jgi:hypothetical protein
MVEAKGKEMAVLDLLRRVRTEGAGMAAGAGHS